MEVLLWLVPAGVVTALAMAWAGWQGRSSSRVLDRDEAVRRLGEALERPATRHPPAPEATRRPDRSTSVAVRRNAPLSARPTVEPAAEPPIRAIPADPVPGTSPTPRPEPHLEPPTDEQRRSA